MNREAEIEKRHQYYKKKNTPSCQKKSNAMNFIISYFFLYAFVRFALGLLNLNIDLSVIQEKKVPAS